MFLAHKNDIPTGGHFPVEQLHKKQVLVNGDNPYLVSNICPHQKSLISTEAGTGNRVCPYHNWTFTPEGTPVTSGRTGHYCKNEMPLARQQVFECNSMYFNMPIDCPELDFLDLSNMKLLEYRVDHVNASPISVMDLFLDVDHIGTVHAGVYDQIGLKDIAVEWHYYKWGTLQLVPKEGGGYGAAWMSVFPGTMIEWQPGALFVTVTQPSNFGTDVHVFKYKDSNSNWAEWNLNDQVWETAWRQDRDQAELLTENVSYNLEHPKKHFRLWSVNQGFD
jgi:phenylpropionate dioxygenase-like ring-hydroxylating dioxygenase large terminal subunit